MFYVQNSSGHMKILIADQIRALDNYTIEEEPVPSIDLMERASKAFVRWYTERFNQSGKVLIFAGLGNNGGDGLAIARLLDNLGYEVEVNIINYSDKRSEDFEENLHRLEKMLMVNWICDEEDIENALKNGIIIDAILGTGVNRPLNGIIKETILRLNRSNSTKISVDIATGLYTDSPVEPDAVIFKPDFTVTFQLPKLAMLLPENENFVGNWYKADIGLHVEFIENCATDYFYTDKIQPKIRSNFSHKGTFGHALLIAGSYGSIGAAILASKACLRSGVGLLTALVPECGYEIMQVSVPEAMCKTDVSKHTISTLPKDLTVYNAVGIGCGLGKALETVIFLENILKSFHEINPKKGLVLDADALNILSENKKLLDLLPPGSVLTPHPKEFQRLAGGWANDFERLKLLRQFAIKYKVIVVLKGRHSAVALPNGSVHFNSTGNAGMATGGSGDVLTGIITGLLAQGYPPEEAAISGVFKHGEAGDFAAQKSGQMAMIAGDIIENLRW